MIKYNNTGYDTYTVAQIGVIKQLDTAFKNLPSTNSVKSLQMFHDLFTSCTNAYTNQTGNNRGLLDVITSGNGMLDYPMMRKNYAKTLTQADAFSLMGTVEGQRNVATLLQSYASSDWKSITHNAWYVYMGTLSQGTRQIYINGIFAESLTQYAQLIASVTTTLAKEAGENVDQEMHDRIIKEAQELVVFETKLARITIPAQETRISIQQYNEFNTATAKKRWPQIDFENYWQSLLVNVTGGYDELMRRDRFLIQFPSYTDALNGLLIDTPPRLLVNYITWRYINDNLDFLADGTLYTTYQFTNYLPMITGRVYVGIRNDSGSDIPRINADVLSMSQRIVKSFLGMIEELPWMTAPSKANAQEKAANLERFLSYPPDILDDDYLDMTHERWIETITNAQGNDYFTNMQSVKFLTQMDNFYTILNEYSDDRKQFGGPITAVNAWYNPYQNSITFPLAVLQPPMYDVDFPEAVNYGNQGGTAGHELTHGYDDEGVQFFLNGTLHKYIDAKSSLGFSSMAQCVIGQYSAHCCPPNKDHLCANGHTTQGENIADIGGQGAAYRAYRDYVKTVRNGVEEKRLPGLESYTMNQVFWMSYAYTWCNTESAEEIENLILTDVHAPDTCRTNQVLRDLPQFAADFGCKTGKDYMAPVADQRCTVW